MKLIEKIGRTKDCYGEEIFSPEISDMVGVTFTEIIKHDDELIFVCDDGQFIFGHYQDCCEKVYIESIVGNLDDLIGEPLLIAEESSIESPSDIKFDYSDESHTWTFYKFATRKGYVDVRWLGESSGYYSEKVNLEFALMLREIIEIARRVEQLPDKIYSLKEQEFLRDFAKLFEIKVAAREREACAKLIEAEIGMNPIWQKHLAAKLRGEA